MKANDDSPMGIDDALDTIELLQKTIEGLATGIKGSFLTREQIDAWNRGDILASRILKQYGRTVE